MDENLLRFLMLAVFIAAALTIAAIAGELSSYSLADPFESYYPSMEFSNVTGLLERMPLEEHVSLSGSISLIEEDYVSKNGYEYQQFYITDGFREVKVFCSKRSGSINLEPGDEVFLSGKFQKYYDTLEIYTDCSSVNLLSDR